MPDDMIRTFIAVELPRSVRDTIEQAIAPVRRDAFGLSDPSQRGNEARKRSGGKRAGSSIQWASPSGWHITTKFLGELTEAQVQEVIRITQSVADESTPFDAAIGEWGAFPRVDSPKVIWLGLEKGKMPISAVANRLEGALAAERFPPEDRAYHPHLTIARLKNPRQGADVFAALRAEPLVTEPFQIDRLVVYSSKLTRRGARYTKLAECMFAT